MIKKLSEITKEEQVEVIEIAPHASNKEELEYLGFVSGCKTEIIYKAPFSGPLVMRLKGTKIALRQQDADKIHVKYN